jgi:hypothetical protein
MNDAIGRVAQAQEAYKKTPTPETKEDLDNAKTAQQMFQDAETTKARIQKDLDAGDPDVLAGALFSGAYSPQQLFSARSMSKPVYTKMVAKLDDLAKQSGAPELLDAQGHPTGHYFDAAKAASDYTYASSVPTQDVLKKIQTLNEPGGDFDILSTAAKALPKMDSGTLNKIFNVSGKEFGSTAATNYHMALYNMASLLRVRFKISWI